jgi:thiol-disulfide isomerase/thioredoxin
LGVNELPRFLPRTLIALSLLLAPLVAVAVPRQSPEYAVKLTTGRQLLLSSYRGRVVVLMFVSTDCPHCQAASRLMEGIQKEYRPRGLQTLAVAFNDMAMMLVPGFINQTGASFPVGYDARESVFSYLQLPLTFRMFVPAMVFIDRQGMIRGQYLGDDKFFDNTEKNIRSMLETLLKEPAAAPQSASKAPPRSK